MIYNLKKLGVINILSDFEVTLDSIFNDKKLSDMKYEYEFIPHVGYNTVTLRNFYFLEINKLYYRVSKSIYETMNERLELYREGVAYNSIYNNPNQNLLDLNINGEYNGYYYRQKILDTSVMRVSDKNMLSSVVHYFGIKKIGNTKCSKLVWFKIFVDYDLNYSIKYDNGSEFVTINNNPDIKLEIIKYIEATIDKMIK